MSDATSVVLVVDDNETNRDVLSRRIVRYGHDVETAANGREALDMVRASNYDLVLLDIMMPEMNGYQVLERIKEDPELRNLPVIVISALDDIDSIVRCIKLGAEDYLPKPFNPMILRARIGASLEKKRLRDQEEEHLEQQAMSQRIDRELNARLDMNRTSEIALGWAIKQTSAHFGFIGEVLPGHQEMHIVAVEGGNGETEQYEQKIIPVTEEEISRAIETLMPQASENSEDGYFSSTARSRLVMPIGRAGQIIALLVLEDESDQRYGNKEISFLTRLADRAAIAMSNALLYEEVQKANMAKTEFVSEVSHELKNPMTSILNYAKMIGAMGSINDTQGQFVETIISNVNRMSRLVADLSDMSRIESGHLRLELEKADIDKAVHEVVQSLKGQIAEKEQTLTLDVDSDLPHVYADGSRLIQILTNLVSNSHKYTEEGGEIIIHAHIHDADNRGQTIQMAVEDNGIGLREEDQQKIFQKYFRAADDKAQASPGTGLGLKITKQLVELQGGQIWFESEFRKGTTFHFTVPVWQEQFAEEMDPEPVGD